MGHTLEPSVDPVLHPVSDQDSRVIYVLRYVRQVGLCTGFPWSRKKSQIFNFKLKSLKYVHILHIE